MAFKMKKSPTKLFDAKVIKNLLASKQGGANTRYFIRTKNTKSIVEVTETTFGQIGAKISDVLYVGFELDWKISGNINDVYDNKGIRKEAGVRDTNRRTLQRLEQEQIGITEKLGNLIQFYRN